MTLPLEGNEGSHSLGGPAGGDSSTSTKNSGGRAHTGSPCCGKRSRSPRPEQDIDGTSNPGNIDKGKPVKRVQDQENEDVRVEGMVKAVKIARSSDEELLKINQQQALNEKKEGSKLDSKPPARRTLGTKRTPLPLAANLREFMKAGATKFFSPRPEWYLGDQNGNPNAARRRHRPSNPIASAAPRQAPIPVPAAAFAFPLPPGLMVAPGPFVIPASSSPIPLLSTFGRDFDPALHVTIRETATEAAIALLEWGAPVESENAKGVTPLILASQKGNKTLVRELIRRGAVPSRASANGTTAVLQAAHFGHMECLELLFSAGGVSLMEMANFNHTTPLMRAAQEGHVRIVEELLNRGASVNRRNQNQMTALMLASQRNYSKVCQILVNKGAELDSMTAQHSTSLLLATKRGNVEVVKCLVAAGCELWVQDSRGRTAREVAQRREMKDLVPLIDSNVQLDLMQRQQRRQRSYDMVALWNLLQQERAMVPLGNTNSEESGVPRTCRQVTIHQISQELQPKNPIQSMSCQPRNLPPNFDKATQALLRTMALPAPLLESISKYLPMPPMWERRVGMLTKRSAINADATVTCALDLIDEILEEGGFAEACDFAQVVPPTHFGSWRDWKIHCRLRCRRGGHVELPGDHRERPVATAATVPKPKFPSVLEMRRQVGFLQLLANRTPVLTHVLAQHPYNMPGTLVQQLATSSDIQSLVRRMGSRGVHFEPAVAMDLIMLINRLCSWFSREREDKPYPIHSSVISPPLAQRRHRALPMRVPLDLVNAPFQYDPYERAGRQETAQQERPSAPAPAQV